MTILRNVAIIAHVDHGKTTLVDAMLRQSGVFSDHEAVVDRLMDSNDLERERGITILAKQASMIYRDHRINIIDTPGHADFGGEVERILRMADGALLLVDAAEGPLPQTRFVLSKSLALGMPILVLINKIDRSDARPDEVLNEVFDLFCELDATEEQTDFPVLYCVGRDGIASPSMEEEGKSLLPLFQMIVDRIPAPTGDVNAPFRFLVHNIEHDDYVGRLAIGRIDRGTVADGKQIILLQENGEIKAKIGNIWGYEGAQRVRRQEASAGDIVAISGIESVEIGDTLSDPETLEAMPRIKVEEPTIKIRFVVNNSPFLGLSGKWVTTRHVRDRLEKEAKRNIALRIEDSEETDSFVVYGRGELMLAILAETMRREGYEFALGMPEVVVREIDGKKCEPRELVVVDVPEEYVGAVTQGLGERRGRMVKMASLGKGRTRVEYLIPSRGLIGFRSTFLTDTRGTGILNTMFDGWEPWGGPMNRRTNGALVSDRKGRTTPYAIFNLQPRGVMCVGPGTQVYEGMVVGENSRPNDLVVNICREKKMTNVRSAGRDENVILIPPTVHTIETAMEWIDKDELVEITPDSIRIRKRMLAGNLRPKRTE